MSQNNEKAKKKKNKFILLKILLNLLSCRYMAVHYLLIEMGMLKTSFIIFLENNYYCLFGSKNN